VDTGNEDENTVAPAPLAETMLPAPVTVAKPNLRERIFETIKKAGDRGLTDREIQKKLNLGPNSVRPRRVELWKAGRVKIKRTHEGNPAYRNLGTRQTATVWVVGEEEVCPHCGSVYTKTFKQQKDDDGD
jgi:hypothetical protein